MPTINDVAKRANVSVGTVSHVINNMPHVTPATRAKVEKAIEELGYVPRAAARSLRSKQMPWLALVVPTITNTYWHAVVRGVEDAAQSRGYAVLLGNTDDNLAKQDQYIDVAIGQNVAGVIIAPCNPNAQHLAKLRDQNIPTITINRRIEGWNVDGVYSDSISASRTLVQHLINLGHKRIAMISGPEYISPVRDRIAGYCIALAEANIPLNPQLLKSGEIHQTTTGEHLTSQLLEEGLNPTAIFAASNTIARGVISTLGKRGLRIPQDIALVCFGDLGEAYFPFLTHILEPAYEMGINAAQLLFSRLDAKVELQTRQVVLPTRLIIRHSCGSHGTASPSLVIPKDTQSKSVLVPPLTSEERDKFSEYITEVIGDPGVSNDNRLTDYDRADINRLLKALQHQEADRLPHLEFRVASKAIYEYVLERELDYDLAISPLGDQSIKPADQIEFAQRLGMDAVACNFVWRPDNAFQQTADGTKRYIGGSIKSWTDLDHLLPPPSLADQLGHLERYLKAAQGTGVGVAVSFTSFFGSSLLAIGMSKALNLLHSNRRFVETLMNILLMQQEKVLRAVCDRFAEDLAFVVINDRIARETGLVVPSDIFNEIFNHRMTNLITHAKEYRKPVVLHTPGKIDEALPTLADIGFDAVQPVDAEVNDIFALKQKWAGKMAFMGGFPTKVLMHGSQEDIEEKVKNYCVRLASGGGYVLGCSTHITDKVPPENFMAMTKAIHKTCKRTHK